MTVHGKSLTKYFRISLAGFMSVWLSGIVFLVCCDKLNGQPDDSVPMASMEGHCDKMRRKAAAPSSKDSESIAVQNTQTNLVNCCGFMPIVFDKIRKIEKDGQHIAAMPAVARVKFHPPAVIDNASPPAPDYGQAAYPENIFLKNCAFRI